jgi:DNA-binding CsgD family transcriptional regulator
VRLSHRDFNLLQRTILELYGHRDREAFRAVVPGLYLKIIPADLFLLYDCDVDLAKGKFRVAEAWESTPLDNRDHVPQLERMALEHPFTQYSISTGDPSALKFSDFFTARQFHSSKLYSECYRHAQFDRLLGIASFSRPGITTLNSIRRPGAKDFTERDRLIMNLLRPHFDQARRNAELATARKAVQAKPLETYGLTPREREVAHWLAMGKTNPEIAAILGSGARTVEKHVEGILAKLAVENRTAAALVIASADGRGQP